MLQYLLSFALLILGVFFVLFATRLAFSDAAAFKKNKKYSGTMRTVLRGEAISRQAGRPDGTCREAIAVNLKTNRWAPQAALSDEAVDSVLLKRNNQTR